MSACVSLWISCTTSQQPKNGLTCSFLHCLNTIFSHYAAKRGEKGHKLDASRTSDVSDHFPVRTMNRLHSLSRNTSHSLFLFIRVHIMDQFWVFWVWLRLSWMSELSLVARIGQKIGLNNPSFLGGKGKFWSICSCTLRAYLSLHEVARNSHWQL